MSYLFIQGRRPLHFYVCAGLDPTADYRLPHSLGFIDGFSFLVHLVVKVRIRFYKSNRVHYWRAYFIQPNIRTLWYLHWCTQFLLRNAPLKAYMLG